MNRLSLGAVVLLCFILMPVHGQARELYVRQNVGNDANPGDDWGVGRALATIQRGIDLAGDTGESDTIHVAAGTYGENLDLTSGVILYGGYPPDGGGASEPGTNVTIIDGARLGSVVRIVSVNSVTISGFTIQNGAVPGRGGGIHIDDSSSVFIDNNIVRDNTATDDWGGGIAVVHSSIDITNNLIQNNQADSAGGGLSFYDQCSGTVSDNTIERNRAANGGGIMIDQCDLLVTRNEIADNSTDSDGAGIYLAFCTTSSLIDNIISNNNAGYDGGGIFYDESSIDISRNTIENNTCSNWGGGICVYGASGRIRNNVISGNTANIMGGGLSYYDNSSAILQNNTIVDNMAGEGGGIYCYADTEDQSTTTVINTIVRRNNPEQLAGGGIFIVEYSNIEGGSPGSGNIDGDPLFVSEDDYHLTPFSPCIDAGRLVETPADDAGGYDIDGETRPQGQGFDMGADEYRPVQTGEAPTVTTGAATSVTSNSATLNGRVNPNGISTTFFFQYGTALTPFGVEYDRSTNPVDVGSSISEVQVNATITGLTPDVTYHFRIAATNSGGTSYGPDLTFITSTTIAPPMAITGPATSLTSDFATLSGTVNPNGDETIYYFEYGTTTDYGSASASLSAGSGTNNVSASVNITGLDPNTTYHYRLVATNSAGTSLGSDGVLTTPDQPPEDVDTGYLVTDELWIRAVIDTEEKGSVEAVWQVGGQDTTSAEDLVLWGHFYASPEDVAWGSPDNPDLFVKIWFDHSGRVDVNFFHVSVPDIEVYSDYFFDNSPDEQDTTTMTTRYIRQYYQNGESFSETQEEDGEPPEDYTVEGDPSGYSTINDLRIGAIINTQERGPIQAVWRIGGQDSTDRGDQVVWGHFYASPEDVTWGSPNNPDLFVKIWFDAGGRVDVNFFHVSVPDIEVYSDFPEDGNYDDEGTTIMANRYIRHMFSMSGDCTDDDGDGYGVGTECVGSDCDDDDPDIYPGATEICDDRIDNDCDLLVDEGCEVAK